MKWEDCKKRYPRRRLHQNLNQLNQVVSETFWCVYEAYISLSCSFLGGLEGRLKYFLLVHNIKKDRRFITDKPRDTATKPCFTYQVLYTLSAYLLVVNRARGQSRKNIVLGLSGTKSGKRDLYQKDREPVRSGLVWVGHEHRANVRGYCSVRYILTNCNKIIFLTRTFKLPEKN